MRTEIDARELWERLHGKHAGPFFLLDVRNEDEAATWRIEGPLAVPVIQVPYFAFVDDEPGSLAKVPGDLGEAVVVCAKGGSSEFVAEVLRGAGRPAVNLAGGMVAWGDLHVPLRIPLERGDEGRFELWQVNRYGKGCLSYVAIAGGEAAVIDPSRFPEVYERLAGERGARIVEVLETHVHADHLSGGLELARRHGARYRVADPTERAPAPGVDVRSFGEEPVRLGGRGGVAIEARAIRTPGHTPGSTSFLIAGRYLLSGDTLFVRGVGRPDLGGQLEEWGTQLFHTLREVVSPLSDEVAVLPAHFSSMEETGPGGEVRGRLGDLRARAPEFAIADRAQFLARIKAGVRPAPATYADIVRANLGLTEPGEKAGEWELGRNECAASAARRAPG